MPPLVSLSRSRTSINADSAELALARDGFARQHAILVPRLLDPELLAFLQAQIEMDGFQERIHEGLRTRPVDLALNHGVAAKLLALVMNDPAFLEFARALTNRPEIRSFLGRVHRRVPGAGHEDAWHDDLADGRITALTINLSARPYEGGMLQIRDDGSQRIVYELANTGAGDGVFFELHERLEHRVTTPTGSTPRTVCAGWFRTEPVREFFGLHTGA